MSGADIGVEGLRRALIYAWDASDTLPPIDFTEEELDALIAATTSGASALVEAVRARCAAVAEERDPDDGITYYADGLDIAEAIRALDLSDLIAAAPKPEARPDAGEGAH